LPYHLIIPVESHLCVFQEGLECITFSLIGFRSCNVCVSLPFSTQLIWVNPVPYCCGEWITGIGDRQLLNLLQPVLISGQPDLSSYTDSHDSQTVCTAKVLMIFSGISAIKNVGFSCYCYDCILCLGTLKHKKFHFCSECHATLLQIFAVQSKLRSAFEE